MNWPKEKAGPAAFGPANDSVNLRITGNASTATRIIGRGINPERDGRTKARVVLADDNRAILDELETLLCSEFEIAGSVSEAGSVLQVVFSLKPNIVICDLDINGFSGIDFGHAILEKRLCAAVIILTMYNEPDLIYRALQAGIRGYVFKVDAGEELITALYTVEAGGQYLSRSIAARTRNGDAEDQSSPGG